MALETGGGSADAGLLVAEPQAGRMLHVEGGRRRVLAEGLQAPVGLADVGDGTILVAESGTGPAAAGRPV